MSNEKADLYNCKPDGCNRLSRWVEADLLAQLKLSLSLSDWNFNPELRSLPHL
ncbi:hypothetical protein Osc7112_2442 [Oscillatoria nigro-viridis PCC 7112]|uniref:Uncharacterized protein n=1 Tax=Phormidium nigroviride PCC 7112 TaxID=179408 RepID=K9VI11_9CYAN|nr:hypothetical protein Osc7112_2442 [Oscillatoria nigro-viridis PCC 7112]